jgi:transcriptional regulator with XRE-family HTH domain
MDDVRLGNALRAVRLRRRLTQTAAARLAGVSGATVSRLESGRIDRMTVAQVRRVGRALDVGIELAPRWHGGELERLVRGRHAALHEVALARLSGLAGWEWASEVTYAVYGERGVIDLVGWHVARRSLLVVELKTELVDVSGLLAQVDRYRRLARAAVRTRGWHPAEVSIWALIADSRTARRRIADHRRLLGSTFTSDGHAVRRWLREPVGAVAALSCLPSPHAVSARRMGRPRAPERRARPGGAAAGLRAS